MVVTKEGNELVVRIKLQQPKLSATGKNWTIASTGGCKPTELQENGKPVQVNLTAFYSAKD